MIDGRDVTMVILSAISKHDGEWGWYQLDRGLTFEGIVGVHIPSVMASLRSSGLIRYEGDMQRESTRYWMTDAGRAALRDADEARSTPDRGQKVKLKINLGGASGALGNVLCP